MNYNRLFFILFLTLVYSQNTYIDSTIMKNPSYSWKLCFIPGLGQLYNGNWHKSFFINSALSLSYIEMHDNENNINKRNTWAWWIFGIYAFGFIDAYVDAHLTSFPTTKKNKTE